MVGPPASVTLTGTGTVGGGAGMFFGGDQYPAGASLLVGLAARRTGTNDPWTIFTASGTVGSSPAPEFVQFTG